MRLGSLAFSQRCGSVIFNWNFTNTDICHGGAGGGGMVIVSYTTQVFFEFAVESSDQMIWQRRGSKSEKMVGY